MKRKGLKVAICLMAGTMLATSCVGSFTMFNKLAKWNKRATDSKFLNELIFIVISQLMQSQVQLMLLFLMLLSSGQAIIRWLRILVKPRILRATMA